MTTLTHKMIGLFLLIAGQTFAQNDSIKCPSNIDTLTNIRVYTFVDKMPDVKGGLQKLFEELYKKMIYPVDYGDFGGRVWVAFIIDIDGKLIGKRIIRDPSGDKFGNQILSLIDNLEWIVGECNYKKVPVLYKLPVRIDLR